MTPYGYQIMQQTMQDSLLLRVMDMSKNYASMLTN